MEGGGGEMDAGGRESGVMDGRGGHERWGRRRKVETRTRRKLNQEWSPVKIAARILPEQREISHL